MGEEKKTQLGTTPGRTQRPTGNPPIAAAAGTPVPATGTPAPSTTPAPGAGAMSADEAVAMSKAKTSYLAEAPDPIVGSTIAGRYQVIKKLGEGGMGSVYLALHTVLEKQVALKILHGEFARKPDLVERFMQEAKAASRIRHENVIDISDFGATPDGLVFFAMELLKGHDLHDEITRAKLAGKLLPWSRTKKIFLQICSALAAAHARGIIHRDLKPENVYLVEFLDDPDFVKLLDFGIAKMTDVSGNPEEGARKLTKTGMLFGTPEYMSPEQARGEKVDHRVDVYAMGCILFQLVSNSVPFQADNFMGVLSQHLTAEPPQIAPEVFDQIGAPRAIADVIDKALVKDPNERYQTIDELASAVREVCGDAPPPDRSTKLRAASVDAPATTTRQRPPTGQVSPAGSSTTMRSEKSTGRVKTQWTGNITVPEVVVELPPPPARSKLPLVIGAGVLVVGSVAVAALVLRGGAGGGNSSVATPGSGSATIVTPPVGEGSAAVATTTPPSRQPELPALVSVTFDTTPRGALIVDATDAAVTFGRTPATFSIPGSTTPRRFKFVLKGYGDNVVELIPNRASIDFTKELVKAGKPDAVTTLPDLGKPADTSAVTRPDVTGTGSAAAATPPVDTTAKPDTTTARPDPGTAEPKPDTTTARPDPGTAEPKPDTTTAKPDPGTPDPGKPDGSGARKPDCPDDEVPCLKSFP